MSTALKDIFAPPLLGRIADDIQNVWLAFPAKPFLDQLFDANWQTLELKARIRRISQVLRAHLPAPFPEALDILLRTTQGYIDEQGERMTFEYLFLPDFVETHGIDFPDESVNSFEIITRWCSAEFAVRPFLIRYPERMYAQMLAWSKHGSPLVRRLSSEGIRPRLPWGMGLPALKRDPAPILPILENLKNDPAETVRRSVANNLNDIAKDHPQLVLDIAKRWLGHSAETDRIVRHACRGLLKKGNADALAHFGFEKERSGLEISGLKTSEKVNIGGRLDFSFTVKNTSEEPARIRLEYAVEYRTLSGKASCKVFRIKELTLAAGASDTIKRHQRFQDLTIRKHYPGTHNLKIILNGNTIAETIFQVY